MLWPEFAKAARRIEARDARYWRAAYEDLVRQTGRDLNDGHGVCKCRPVPSPLATMGDQTDD